LEDLHDTGLFRKQLISDPQLKLKRILIKALQLLWGVYSNPV